MAMIDDHRVILEVQRHRILYDPANPFYKDNMRKEHAWSEVAAALKADPAECKCRWRMLRDSFVKYQKKITTTSLPPGSAPRDWKYTSSMAFILPFIQNRAPKRRLQPTPEPERERVGRPSSQDPSPCPALPAGPSSSSPLQLWSAPLEEERPPVTDSEREEIYHFVMSTVPQLLRLVKRTRRRAKLEILQVLDRLEEEDESLAAAKRYLCPSAPPVYRPESTAPGRISKRKSLKVALAMAERRKRKSRFWVHPTNQQRRLEGDYYHLVQELRMDSGRHYQYFRMSAEQMDTLLSIVGPDLTRQSTTYRAAIEPKQRLAVGLRYLASGDSFASLAFRYRLGQSTVRNSVYMLCEAIKQTMMAEYLPTPTEDTWREIADGFWKRWNFPNCLGALDGKHIVIEKPPRSGSLYSTYTKIFSVVLMALVDAEHRFRVINVLDFGRSSDDGLYAASALGVGLEEGTLNVPPSAPLPGDSVGTPMPYVIISDAAFPLKTYLMKPYPGPALDQEKTVFNDRVSRARAVVEDAFSILASRWRIFHRRINLMPQNVDSVVFAACILHNFLSSPKENQQLLEEAQQQGKRLRPVGNVAGRRTSNEARSVRDAFSAYFNSPEGIVSWQEKI